jgi:hypothetical protein
MLPVFRSLDRELAEHPVRLAAAPGTAEEYLINRAFN